MWDTLTHPTTLLAMLDIVVLLVFLPWVIMSKKNATSAVAWCLTIIMVPLLGALLFWVFGYSHLSRPLRRVRKQRFAYRAKHPPRTEGAIRGKDGDDGIDPLMHELGQVARNVRAFPITHDNAVTLYHDTKDAFAGLITAIREARHHVHLEFFILRSDPTCDALIAVLAEKARTGVEVRLLYDAMGCVRLKSSTLRPLVKAGGKADAFLPLNPLRSRIQVNLRNHRKIVVVDGKVGFTGGMNIGDEYLGRDNYFRWWRDSFLRVEGPAVAGLQRVFAEDWDFAFSEALNGDAYFPNPGRPGDAIVQVVESGPDQAIKSIREMYFAAILGARERVWITTPYFVPDGGLLDALRLARYRGVDVRVLTIGKPDHWLAYMAGRYYFPEMLAVGVKIYQYRKGMMHAKILTADGKWGMVGSANLDNRSLHLSFEAGCALYTPALVAELDEQFERDLANTTRVDPDRFACRSSLSRLAEHATRLLSPLL